jgi:hypothetical protein
MVGQSTKFNFMAATPFEPAKIWKGPGRAEVQDLSWLVFNMRILRVEAAQGIRCLLCTSRPSALPQLQKQHFACEWNAPSPCRFGIWWIGWLLAFTQVHEWWEGILATTMKKSHRKTTGFFM